MTLTDHLKNISEHRYVPCYGQFPMFVVNRFFSFSDRTCAIITNKVLNHQHWLDMDSETQQKTMHQVLPKRKYNWFQLFGGYVKNEPKIANSVDLKVVEYAMTYFECSEKEALTLLQNEGLHDDIKTRLS